MFVALIRRQCFQFINCFYSASQKLPYSNSSLVRSEPKLKALINGDKQRTKERFKKHFIENLFVEQIQEDILEYPEINSLKEFETLSKQQDFAQRLMLMTTENDEYSEIDSKKLIASIKKLDLTGLKLSHLLNGFGYLESEYMYMLEALSLDPAMSKALSENEDFGIQLINSFGSDVQKQTYLAKLGSGESLTCFAHVESHPIISLIPVPVSTTATLSPDGQSYIVSGKKNWVYNASFADVIIFSAGVKTVDGEESKTTLFVIDKNSSGIKVHEPIETVGLKGLDICEITFDNVVVPVSSVLGAVQEGDKLINKVLTNGKLNNGAQCITIIKRLINSAIDHCINNKMVKKYKFERNFFQEKLGRLVSRLYTVESATYFVTGRKDSFREADVFLESLIVKIHASETLHYVWQETLAILGTKAFDNYNGLEEVIKDAHFFPVCDVTNDYLRLFLSHIGCNYAMKHNTSIFSLFKDLFSRRNRDTIWIPFSEHRIHANHILQGYVHTMFEKESALLEGAIKHFKDATNYLMNKHGEKIFDRHFELRLLADMLLNIYIFTATLGRASRAFCLAGRHHDIDQIIMQAEGLRLYHIIKNLKESLCQPSLVHNLDKFQSKVVSSKSFGQDYPVLKNILMRN